MDVFDLTGRQKLYEQGYFGQDVIIAEIDSGINLHELFEGNLIEGFTMSAMYPANTRPLDDLGHGTHVAGIAARIAPKAKIVSVKVVDGMGGSNANEIALAIKKLITMDFNGKRLDLIGLSLSFPEGVAGLDILHEAVKNAVEAGVPVFVSAGNSGDNSPRFPSHWQEPIVVGSVSSDLKTSFFSSFHKDVDFCQIGEDISSADYKEYYGYVSKSGTSQARPMVTGIAALLISQYKFEHSGEYMPEPMLYETLIKCARDINAPGRDFYSGYGFITLNKLYDHWAQADFDFMNANGIPIYETRFDDNITRGEAIAMQARMYRRILEQINKDAT